MDSEGNLRVKAACPKSSMITNLPKTAAKQGLIHTIIAISTARRHFYE